MNSIWQYFIYLLDKNLLLSEEEKQLIFEKVEQNPEKIHLVIDYLEQSEKQLDNIKQDYHKKLNNLTSKYIDKIYQKYLENKKKKKFKKFEKLKDKIKNIEKKENSENIDLEQLLKNI